MYFNAVKEVAEGGSQKRCGESGDLKASSISAKFLKLRMIKVSYSWVFRGYP